MSQIVEKKGTFTEGEELFIGWFTGLVFDDSECYIQKFDANSAIYFQFTHIPESEYYSKPKHTNIWLKTKHIDTWAKLSLTFKELATDIEEKLLNGKND